MTPGTGKRNADTRNWLSVLLAAAAAVAGCAINPVTGERQLALISEEQEIELGRQTATDVERQLGLVDDAELQAYVDAIGQRMARASERPDLPWAFGVIDDPTPNAFAVPGGFIYVTRGMMNLMRSEAELAAVVGHEIGHVTARHSVTQLSRAQLAQLGLGIGMILSPELQQLGELAAAGLQLLFLSYGREDERQADELGFRYMLDENYDVREMANVFVSLQRAGELAGQSPLPNWLSSHPAPPERIEAARERAAALEQPQQSPVVERDAYMQRIDGLVYGENPRNGFFLNGNYYHPELEFQLDVPADWTRQNLPQAVVAGHPEGEAALQLTLVGAEEVEQAAQAFFAQEGVRQVSSTREDLRGNDAVVSGFQGQTQQGIVQGYVTHVRHSDATFQLVALAPEPRFRQHDRLLAALARSFQPLTDERLLDVQPRRVEIVRIDEEMSLEEFAEAHPSSVPIEELALINRVEDVGAPIAAGTPLKRVVGEAPG